MRYDTKAKREKQQKKKKQKGKKKNQKAKKRKEKHQRKNTRKSNRLAHQSYRDWETDRKSTRLNSSHSAKSRMPSSA